MNQWRGSSQVLKRGYFNILSSYEFLCELGKLSR
jgi:hypothetical protein